MSSHPASRPHVHNYVGRLRWHSRHWEACLSRDRYERWHLKLGGSQRCLDLDELAALADAIRDGTRWQTAEPVVTLYLPTTTRSRKLAMKNGLYVHLDQFQVDALLEAIQATVKRYRSQQP